MIRYLYLFLLPSFIAFGQSANKNYVLSKTYPNGLTSQNVDSLSGLEQPDSTALKSIVYSNGWAEGIQTMSLSDQAGYVIVSNMEYDALGRPIIATKPLQISNDSLNYKTYTNWLSDSSFERTTYFNEPGKKVQYRMPYGAAFHQNNHYLNFDYFLDTTAKAFVTASSDEDGNTSQTFTDVFGRKIRQVTKNVSGQNDFMTTFEYDGLGNILRTFAPQGFITDDTVKVYSKTRLYATTPANTVVVRYSKPNNAIETTVNITLKDTLIHDEIGGNVKGCGYSLSLQYRIQSKGVVAPAWFNLTGSDITLQLFDADTAVEVRQVSYSQSNQPAGCYQYQANLFLSASALCLDQSKYATTFKYDKRGQITAKYSADEDSTKYVYDAMGKLRFVQDASHKQNFKYKGQRSYWTYYKYDDIGRMTEQGEVLYNFARETLVDRIRPYQQTTCTTDTFQVPEVIYSEHWEFNETTSKWQLVRDTIYSTRDSIVTTCVSSGNYAVIKAFPSGADTALPTVVNQYDTYATSGWSITVDANMQNISFPKTRLTRSKILDPNTNAWTEEAYVYDRYGRMSKRWVLIPELASVKSFKYYYDASGRVLKSIYQDGVQTESFYQWFEYDKLSRLDTVFSSRSNNRAAANREAVYDYSNNNGGKVAQIRYGHTALQTVDYAYTSRDWLKSINDENNLGTDRFAMTLYYYEAGLNPRYNGNIARMTWNTNGTKGGYDYTYDAANRLTDATFGISLSLQNQTLSGTYTNNTGDVVTMQDVTSDAGAVVTIQSRTDMTVKAGFNSGGATMTLKAGESSAGSGSTSYSEKNITYDANGNILTLTRGNNAAMNYYYNAAKPNRLDSVKGGYTARFRYDANGNMTSDGANNFAYDYRNMPITDTIKSGTTVVNIIKYAYDAAGQRIKMLRYSSTGTTLLDNSRIYVLNSNGKLMAEYVKNGSAWRLDHYNIYGNELLGKLDSLQKRYYYLTDHLGSVRVTVKDTAGVPVDSWSDYYPFGKEARGSSTSSEPKEGFTGYQYDAESTLNYAGARYYNPEIGRFLSTDPLHQFASDYVYCGNNPIALIDPSGKAAEDYSGFNSAAANRDFSEAGGGSSKYIAKSDADHLYQESGGDGESSGGGSQNGTQTSSSGNGQTNETVGPIYSDGSSQSNESNQKPETSNSKFQPKFTWWCYLGIDFFSPATVEVKAVQSIPYSKALSKAVEWLENYGFKAEKKVISKMASDPNLGKTIGMATKDGRIGFRVEFTSKQGAHINVFNHNIPKPYPHFYFNGTQKTVDKIVRQFKP